MYKTRNLSSFESCRLDELAELLALQFEREFPRLHVVEFSAIVGIREPRLRMIAGRLKLATQPDGSDAEDANNAEAPLRGQSGPRWASVDFDRGPGAAA